MEILDTILVENSAINVVAIIFLFQYGEHKPEQEEDASEMDKEKESSSARCSTDTWLLPQVF